jgi:hypothetical protein
MDWDDPGSIALVVCDGGGNLRCVADSKVYLQSGPSQQVIDEHQFLSDSESGKDSSPPPTTHVSKVAIAAPNTQRSHGPLPAKAKSAIADKRQPKRPRDDVTDEDEGGPPPRRKFPSGQRMGDTARTNVSQVHRPIMAPARATAHVASQPTRFPSQHSSQTTTTRMSTSRSHAQPPSRNTTQYVSRPSTSTFTAPRQRTLTTLPPVFEDEQHGTSMGRRVGGQRGTTHSNLMMPPPSNINSMACRGPGRYTNSMLASRSQNQFIRGSSMYHTGQEQGQGSQYVPEIDQDSENGHGEFVDQFEDNLTYDQGNEGANDYNGYY